jgi:hypothetical protein
MLPSQIDVILNTLVYFPTCYELEEQGSIFGRNEEFSIPYRA